LDIRAEVIALCSLIRMLACGVTVAGSTSPTSWISARVYSGARALSASRVAASNDEIAGRGEEPGP
jgi:hypothetical protein